MQQIMQRVEASLVGETDPIRRRRMLVYRLRVMGYTLETIAEELNMSYGTAHGDLEWCFANLPPVFANAEDFRRVSVPQLEGMFEQLVTPQVVLEQTDTGETIQRLQMPSVQALRTAKEIKDTQAKLLGAYKPVVVDDGAETITYSVTVSKQLAADTFVEPPQRAIEGKLVTARGNRQTDTNEGLEEE